MFEILAATGFWFWASLLVEILLLTAFVVSKQNLWALFSLFVFVIACQFMGGIDVINYVKNNPITILSVFFAYFAIGTLWSVVKWYFYCSDALQSFLEAKQEYIETNKSFDATIFKQWLKHAVASHSFRAKHRITFNGEIDIPPSVSNHKEDILGWMTFWPISMLCFLFSDIITRVYNRIYMYITKFLQSISDRIFESVRSDIK
jgi:hypothetical protein